MPPVLKDIRFYILLFLALRLVSITQPPVEVGHNWRQTTVLMVARNFTEGELDLLHPQVDMAGEKSGITGMEFPLLNAAHAVVAKAFGYQHWYGRLIVLLLSSWAMWSLFALLRRVISKEWATATVSILMVSLWFMYSRKIMPDVFACSLLILGAHAYVLGWESGGMAKRWIWSLVGAVAITAGILSKLPSGVLLVGMVPFLWQMQFSWKRLVTLVLVLPGLWAVGWWYYTWVPQLVQEYGFWHFFMGKGISEGSAELMEGAGQAFKHVYDRALKFTGFAAFVGGMVHLIRKREKTALWALALAGLATLAVALKAGDTFVRHDYYILPFIPCMALVAAAGVLALPKPWMRIVAFALIGIEGIANQQHDFFPSSQQQEILQLEAALDEAGVSRNALIAINSGENPAPLYFAHRKGWVMHGDALQHRQDSLQALGLEAVVWLNGSWQEGSLSLGLRGEKPAKWSIIKVWPN